MFSDIYFRLLIGVIEQQDNIDKHTLKQLNAMDHSPSMAVHNFAKLIDIAYADNPSSAVGMRFGEHITPLNACDFSRLLTTATTIDQCFNLLSKMYHTLNLKPFPMVNIDKDAFSISLSFPYEKKIKLENSRFCTETFFSYCINSIRLLINANLDPKEVHLNFPKPSYSQLYEDLFKCPIYFDAPLTMICFDPSVAQLTLPSSNPTLHKVYMDRIEEEWQLTKRDQSFKYRVITQMMKHAPLSFNSQFIADTLTISVRGLQKRLHQENTSFSQISLQVKRELAKICLYQRHYDFNQASKFLGFQTQVSFNGFFKQQFLQTPKQYVAEFEL